MAAPPNQGSTGPSGNGGSGMLGGLPPKNPPPDQEWTGPSDGPIGEFIMEPEPEAPVIDPQDPYRIPIIPDIGMGGAGMRGVNMDDFNPVTRQVQREELTSFQLQSLLQGNSPYMDNARREGREMAAERGAFGSSLMAESSMRAAISKAEPIARADAGAYIQAASENLQVVNANINTKLQAATSIANNMNSNRANMAIANLRERTNRAIAQAEIESRFALQDQNFGHSVLMEELVQSGRIDIANLSADLQRELQENGFEQDIVLSNLSHEQRIYLEETFNQPRFEADYQLRKAQLETGLVMGVMNTYAQFVNNLNGQDIDGDAYQRGMDTINNWVTTTFDALGMANFNFTFDSTPPGDG